MKTILRSISAALVVALAAPAAALVPSTATSRNDLTAAGGTTFAFTFKTPDKTWVEVRLNGILQTSGYTVTLNGNQETTPGGTVTFTLAPAAGTAVRIQRVVPIGQSLKLQPGAALPSAAIEAALDRNAYFAQQLDRKIDDVSAGALPPVTDGSSLTVGATGSTTPRRMSEWLADVASVRAFGATGDGATDDTAALAAAIATGKTVRCTSGDTYLVAGGLVSSAARQTIDFTGCTLKLKDNAAVKWILRLNGDGSVVAGGTWEMNAAGNSTGDQFGHFAVLLSAAQTIADGLHVKNSYGLGIKASGAFNDVEARNCVVEGAQKIGIYFEGSNAADVYGARIVNNRVDVSATTTALGIYIASGAPYTYMERRWQILGNVVLGSLSATAAAVGITGRGVDGIVSGNHVSGFTIGISCDISTASQNVVVSGNRVEGANGPFAGGIEMTGGLNVVSGNYVRGGRYGITGSSTGSPNGVMDGNTYTGNLLEEQTVFAIYVTPGASHQAQRLNISGNTIISKNTAQNGAIRLAGDCRYSQLSGNVIRGPGSASAGGRAVFLDGVNSDVSIQSNRLSGWERAVALYNGGAVAQTRIFFVANDCSEDMGSDTAWVSAEGSATLSSPVVQAWNMNASGVSRSYLEKSSNLIDMASSSFTTPEGNVTAAIGSVYRKTSGSAPILYVKESGSGNTGWVAK